MTAQADFAAELRALADFYDTHPDLPVPILPVRIDLWPSPGLHPRAWLAATAHGLGPLEKLTVGDYFVLRRSFGDRVILDLNAKRDQVCERVVVGTRTVTETVDVIEREVEEEIVEWRCPDSILAEKYPAKT